MSSPYQQVWAKMRSPSVPVTRNMRCTFAICDAILHCCVWICPHSHVSARKMLLTDVAIKTMLFPALQPNVAQFFSKRHLLEADAASRRIAHHRGAPSTEAHSCTVCSGFASPAGLCAYHRRNVWGPFSERTARDTAPLHARQRELDTPHHGTARLVSLGNVDTSILPAPADRSGRCWKAERPSNSSLANPLEQVSVHHWSVVRAQCSSMATELGAELHVRECHS